MNTDDYHKYDIFNIPSRYIVYASEHMCGFGCVVSGTFVISVHSHMHIYACAYMCVCVCVSDGGSLVC